MLFKKENAKNNKLISVCKMAFLCEANLYDLSFKRWDNAADENLMTKWLITNVSQRMIFVIGLFRTSASWVHLIKWKIYAKEKR